MNPDKLFDYLDGKLPDWERTQLEEDLASDPQLQRELTVARRIHSGMRGDSREVLVQDDAVANARGRKMALRVGTAFIILMGVNVAAGLWVIARHEAGNPNRLLERKCASGDALDRASLERCAHSAAVGQTRLPSRWRLAN
jgi:anti-sigma factor RsiW